ncbi:MAG: hypothetical protein ACR2LC_09695 [Pyrinomonadaceae bacterium]
MTNIAVSFNKQEFTRGPGNLFVDTALAASLARAAITTGGLLDAAVHPNAIHIGGTEKGCKFEAKPIFESDQINEVRGDINKAIIGWEMTISGVWRQILNFALLQKVTPGSVLAGNAPSDTFSQILFSVSEPVRAMSIILVARIPSDPTRFQVFNVYAGTNDQPFTADMDATKGAGSPFNFKAEPVPERDPNDQFGTFWKQKAATV